MSKSRYKKKSKKYLYINLDTQYKGYLYSKDIESVFGTLQCGFDVKTMKRGDIIEKIIPSYGTVASHWIKRVR